MKTIGMAALGRDVEVAFAANGTAMARMSLAFSFYKKGEENDRATQWIDGVMWGKQAESLAKYMTKGSKHCFTLSDVHIEEYEAKDGSTRTKLVGRIDDVELGPNKPAEQPAQRSAERQAPAKAAPQRKVDKFDDDVDLDVPF